MLFRVVAKQHKALISLDFSVISRLFYLSINTGNRKMQAVLILWTYRPRHAILKVLHKVKNRT